MEKISLKNISYNYSSKMVFDNLSFDVIKNKNVAIVGTGGCGKTTLAKIFSGDIKPQGQLLINGIEIVESNFYLLNRYVSVVFNERFHSNNKVIDELFNSIDELNLSLEEEKDRVNKIVKFFGLTDLLEEKINTFKIQDKCYVKVICELIKFTEYIVFDDVFVNMSREQVDKIVSFCKKEKITMITITTDIEYVLESDYLIVLYDNGIAMEGKTLECLKEEKVMRRLGFNLPFMVDLSIQLGYYGLLDKIILDDRKMIKAIWK